MKRCKWLLWFATLLCGCASMPGSEATRFSIDQAEMIQTKLLSKNQIVDILGSPDRIEDLEKISSINEKGEIWVFNENGLPRLSIYFEKGADVANGVTWRVRDGEPQQSLKVSLNRFARARWSVDSGRWTSAHTTPDECIYQDKRLGISVEFRRTRKEVSEISWWNPARSPQERDKACTGSGCIGKERWNAPLCDIPK